MIDEWDAAEINVGDFIRVADDNVDHWELVVGWGPDGRMITVDNSNTINRYSDPTDRWEIIDEPQPWTPKPPRGFTGADKRRNMAELVNDLIVDKVEMGGWVFSGVEIGDGFDLVGRRETVVVLSDVLVFDRDRAQATVTRYRDENPGVRIVTGSPWDGFEVVVRRLETARAVISVYGFHKPQTK